MSSTKAVKWVHDSTTIVIKKEDLTRKNVGKELKSLEREIPYSGGLKWWIQWFPAGRISISDHHVSLYLHVNKVVSAKFNFKVERSTIQRSYAYDFPSALGHGSNKFASHDDLWPLLVNDQLTISCNVEFKVSVAYAFQTPRLFQSCEHAPTDFVVVVGSDRIDVHKGLLSLLSPVFHAMFTHDTNEIRCGENVITDFDFDTVNAAIGFCYGRHFDEMTVEMVVGILRFADKYIMKSVIDQLEEVVTSQISAQTVCTIAHYAFDCSKRMLLKKCCCSIAENLSNIKSDDSFTTLPQSLIVHLLKKAFGLETDLEVLRIAHEYSIDFIVDDLEQPILESISLTDFCPVVGYAWDCSRKELKNACAKFFNVNFAEILKLNEFTDLSANKIQGVIKLGNDIESPEPARKKRRVHFEIKQELDE